MYSREEIKNKILTRKTEALSDCVEPIVTGCKPQSSPLG